MITYNVVQSIRVDQHYTIQALTMAEAIERVRNGHANPFEKGHADKTIIGVWAEGTGYVQTDDQRETPPARTTAATSLEVTVLCQNYVAVREGSGEVGDLIRLDEEITEAYGQELSLAEIKRIAESRVVTCRECGEPFYPGESYPSRWTFGIGYSDDDDEYALCPAQGPFSGGAK